MKVIELLFLTVSTLLLQSYLILIVALLYLRVYFAKSFR